jgi:uncharacterized membrane protein
MKQIIVLLVLSSALLSLGMIPAHADEIVLSQTAQAGTTARYTLEIQNGTTAGHTYRLAVDGLPPSLTVTFTQGGPVLDRVSVPANGYGPVTLRIDVPADVPVGHYAAQFIATRDDGAALTRLLTLNVENTYAVSIVGQNTNVSAFSGQTFTFEATVANTGAAPVTHLALQVAAPAKWVVELDPLAVDQLDPGSSIRFTARVLVPASQVSVDQPLPFRVIGDQVSSAKGTVMVRVQKSPSFMIASGALVVLVVAGVLFYFGMRGRR